jgi:hypothetical protein
MIHYDFCIVVLCNGDLAAAHPHVSRDEHVLADVDVAHHLGVDALLQRVAPSGGARLLPHHHACHVHHVPGVNFTNITRAAFAYKNFTSNFSALHTS